MGLANGPFLAAGENAQRQNIREREKTREREREPSEFC